MSELPGRSGDPIRLGRDDLCEVRLPGDETSRFHAEIWRDGPLTFIRDLGSTNGVRRNGSRVERTHVSRGDVIRLGDWIGVVMARPVSCDEEERAPCYRRLASGLLVGPVLGPRLEPARRAATSELPIVVEGETGTGKECVARAIHEWSGRAGPFMAVNCAALPESLAEAELFGYRRGAFTGAIQGSHGHIRAAHGGTLLLDEITDLPLLIQAKLLRALEQREVVPLGESRPVAVDVRVVATAQEPVERAVQEGRFRADLYARLDGLTVELPPLRERTEEVPFLFGELLREHAGGRPPAVEPQLIERLCLYELPFNVRELSLLAHRLMVLHGHEPVLRAEHLPRRYRRALRRRSTPPSGAPEVATNPHRRPPSSRPPPEPVEPSPEQLFDQLLGALLRHRGVVARAAADLGISRQRAYRLMDAHGGVDLDALRGEIGAEPGEEAR